MAEGNPAFSSVGTDAALRAPELSADELAPLDTTFGAFSPRRPIVTALISLAIAFGVFERFYVAAHPIGTLSSDGGVIGLMALQLLRHGDLPAYMWGQSYGGSLEAILTAGVFFLAGIGTAQLLAATALSSALASLALWHAGRRLVGARAATLGALCFWIWPAPFIWQALKPGGTYMLGLAASLWFIAVLARVRTGERAVTSLALAGLLGGLCLWLSPMSLELLVPGVLWCLPALWRARRRLAVLVAGAVLGAFPAIVFGATHGFSNLKDPSGSSTRLSSVPARLSAFFRVEAPLAMSLRVQKSFAWVGGDLGVALSLLVAVAFLLVLWAVLAGRASRCRLPVLTLVCLPFFYALNPLAGIPGRTRYLLFGFSMAALLVGVALERLGRLWLCDLPSTPEGLRRASFRCLGSFCLGLLLLGLLGFGELVKAPAALAGYGTPDVAMPYDDKSLLALLSAHHVHDAYANYWIAYRVDFETDARTIVAPIGKDRYPPYESDVGASFRPDYLFVQGSSTLTRFMTWSHHHKIPTTVWSRGAFCVVEPATKVLPSMVPASVFE